MSPRQQTNNTSVKAESQRSCDDFVKSSVAASTTGAIATVVRKQPRASSASRREERRGVDRRVSSDVIVTSTKHVVKPLKQEHTEKRGHSQTGEQGGELRLTHERLQQYAAAHARLTAPVRTGPRSTAGSTLMRKITNMSALVPSPPQPQQLGPVSPTGAVAAAVVVRTVSSAPVPSPAALSGARLALTTPGIPLPGMGAPTGARPASPQRPQSPRQLLHRLMSFSQAPMPPPSPQPQRQQGAPPPERAFGPRAADYPTRHASPRHALPVYGFLASMSGADYSWQPPNNQLNRPASAKQRAMEPRVSSARSHNCGWTQHFHVAVDSPLGSPAGHGQGGSQGYGGWDMIHRPAYAEAAAVATATAASEAAAELGTRNAQFCSPPASPQRCWSPDPMSDIPMRHHHTQQQQQQQSQPPPTPSPPPPPQQQQLQQQSTELLPHLSSPQLLTQPPFPPYQRANISEQQQQQQQDAVQLPQSPAHDRRLRPWTPKGALQRPHSSGPGAVRWGPALTQGQTQTQMQTQQSPAQPAKVGEVVVVGLRDVPPSQLPFARAVMGPGKGGKTRARRSSDGDTHASWWHGPRNDSEASYPLTAVTDSRALGEDEMTPAEAAMWQSRMAELEAEVLEEREFRRRYEEELRMLATAATAGGRGGRPGGGPLLWQTTGGRVVTGARAAAAAVMRHSAGIRP